MLRQRDSMSAQKVSMHEQFENLDDTETSLRAVSDSASFTYSVVQFSRVSPHSDAFVHL